METKHSIEPHFKISEAATLVRLSPGELRKAIRRGKITATKPAGEWLVPESAIREYLASGRTDAA